MNNFERDVNPIFKEIGVRQCIEKIKRHAEERNWTAYLDQCACAILISPTFFGMYFDWGNMHQFLAEYKVGHDENDVAYDILMLGLVINDGKDWSYNLIEPTKVGLGHILSLIRKLRAENRDNFEGYPLLKNWKLYLY